VFFLYSESCGSGYKILFCQRLSTTEKTSKVLFLNVALQVPRHSRRASEKLRQLRFVRLLAHPDSMTLRPN